MLSFPKIALAAAVAMTLSAAQARAEDQPAPAGEKPAAQASGETSPSDIAKLVTQLDAERFTDRQAASEKLEALGKTAIPELSKAATGESLEASVRAIALLGKFYESSDAATKAAAKTALEAIAKGDNAPAAARAKEALKAEEDEQNPQQAQQGQIIIGNAKGFQLGGPGGFSSKSIQTVNGVKKIDVSAADGKKIKISDGKKEGIKIEVTKKNKEGKEETEKYEAKDVDELKTKFPEGYKIYKEHAEDGAMGMLGGMGALNGLKIQVGGGAMPAIPLQPGQLPAIPGGLGKIIQGQAQLLGGSGIEAAGQLAEQLGELLGDLAKGDELKNASSDDKDGLKKQLGDLKQRIGEMEKRLDEKTEKPAEEKAEK